MSNILKYQNPSSPLLIQQINQSGANFVKRLLDPNRKSIPDWETKCAKIATHKLGWAEDDHGAYVFPEVQEIDGQLIDFSRPPYASGIADYMAHKNNNIVRMSPEEADWFTRNYKQYYPSFKKGGRIHIKKKNRGKFTESAKRAGMGVQEYAKHVLANKNDYSPIQVKRAAFAKGIGGSQIKKHKHENGGILKAQEGTGNKFCSKLWNAVKEGGMAARDAKLGAIGAQQVRDLYSEGKNQEAQDLAKQYAKANTTGIALAGGAASTGLLGDLMVTGATTAADTFIDGDVDNFGKHLVKNAAGDLIGHGTSKLLTHLRTNELNKYIDYLNESRRQELFPKSEDIYYHIDTDARPLFNTNAKLHPSKDASRVLPGLARDEGDTPYIWFNRRATYGTPKHDRIVFGSKEDLHLKPIQETNLPHNEVEGFYVTEGYPNTDKIQMYRGYPISIGGTRPIYVFGKEIFYAPK